MKKRMLAALLAAVMMISVFPSAAFAVEGDGDNPDVPAAPAVVSDVDSRYDYQRIFDDDSTRYDGRIWTDKSVLTGDIVYSGNVHEYDESPISDGSGQVTVELDENNGEDFLVSYSALASTTSVINQSQSPIDMVLVLDLSPMSNSAAGKVDALLTAVQEAIDSMIAANPQNRVAVVAYSSQAEILLPLGIYTDVGFAYSGSPTQQSTVTCTYVPDNGSQGEQTQTFTIARSNGSGVNKYTQMGIYTGMKILTEATGTEISIEEDKVTRQPVLILLSEGEPKIASTNIANPTQSLIPAEGWSGFSVSTAYTSERTDQTGGVEILRNYGTADNTGPGNNTRHAQTFATLLTAAYMKKQVTEHYFGSVNNNADPDDNREALVYTVGIRTSSANSPGLAQVVLDPTHYLVAGANAFSNTFIEYANSYFEPGGSVSIQDAGASGHTTAFTQDSTPGLTADDLNYNDLFFNVTGDGSNLNFGDIFGDILTDITSSAAQGSTHVGSNVDPTQGGYLTYTDPIGEYMEVKDVKAMIINDVIYRTHQEPAETKDNGVKTTTYVFTGMANNPVYGAQELRHIIIQVTEDSADGRETLEVKIPAALLPLRLTTVLKDNNGAVIRYAHNSAFPFRLVYAVGLKNGVLKDGSVNMDVSTGGVSADYIAENTENGQVQFYAGCYSGETEKGQVGNQGRTIGDACVTYVPALDNPFYYVTEDTPLYIRNTDGTYSRATGQFDPDQTYYFEISFYTATNAGSGPAAIESTQWVSRPGTSLRSQSVNTGTDNYLYLKKGEPRLGNLNDFLREKGNENSSGTAQIYLYLYYAGNRDHPEAGQPISDNFEVYHGNNGRRSAPLPDGTLSITKQVVGNADPDQEFEFRVEAHYHDSPNTPVTGEVNGVTFTNGAGTFKLKANETQTFSLRQTDTAGVDWSVEEITTYPAGTAGDWSTEITGYSSGVTVDTTGETASGTLTPGGSEAVTFTNTYTTPTGTLTVRKDVAGDVNAADTTEFSFTLKLENLDAGDKVLSGGSEITLDNNSSYTFTLSNSQSRSFTIPENVNWTVTETSPLNGNWATAVANSETGGTTDNSNRSATGTIAQGDETIVGFINTYTSPGALVISKTVEGAQGSGSYDFTVTLQDSSNQPISGTFDGVTFTDGKAKLTLSDGESQTIHHLPARTQWTVTEDTSGLPSNWTVTANGDSGNTASGVITSGEVSAAAFINSAPGTLTVTKEAEGGSAGQEFSFTLAYGGSSQPFTLTDGDSKNFTLPAGTDYTVTEADPGARWSTTVNGTTGREITGTIRAGVTDTAAFVNTYSAPGSTAYVLRYVSNGGTAYPDERYSPNTLVTLDKTPVREGYTFTGWYADAALTEPVSQVRMTADKTVYAGWEITGVPEWLNGADHFAYVIGYPNGMVEPENDITRAEVATIFFRLLTEEVRASHLTGENSFADVRADDWYNTAVSTMEALGILQGRTETSFAPDAPITRAEFAAICARFDTGRTGGDSNFTDIAGHWAEAEIERAVVLGWITGYPDNTFRPDAPITRAEAMTMINRVLQRLPESAEDLLPDMTVWPDNPPERWYYLAVQEATNSHAYTRKDDGVHETWTELLENPDWAQYHSA